MLRLLLLLGALRYNSWHTIAINVWVTFSTADTAMSPFAALIIQYDQLPVY